MKIVHKRILIIDEDEASSRELQCALELQHYDVLHAASGEEGLETLHNEAVDLAIVDIELPRMSGLGVCEKLRQQRPERLRGIVLTSAFFRGAEEIRSIKADTGARAFLPKPIELPQLIDHIREALSQPPQVGGSEKIEGRLDELAFPKLLRRLSILGTTGLLQLEHGKVRKILYIENGYPIFARSNLVKECLGQMLLKEGRLTQEQFDESLQRIQKSKRLHGTVLIEMGLISPQDLHEALSRQIAEKLLEIFSWTDGYYAFTPGRRFKEGTTSIKQSPASLILEGVQRCWSVRQVRDFLHPYRRQYLRQVDNPLYRFQDMGLNRRGRDLLRECRGECTLEQLLQKFPLSQAEAEKMLASLLLAGMIEPRQVATPMAMDEPGLDGQRPSSLRLREQLLEDYSRMMQLDYFELFGVPQDCSTEAIRKSYYQMAKHYHPDQLLGQGLSTDVQDKVKELFQRITKAYEVLTDADARSHYVEELTSGPRPGVDVSKVLQAETAFQKGLVLLKANDFRKAAELLEQAAKLSPEEPEYLTYCAWAQFKSRPDDEIIRDNSSKMLSYSRKLNPKLDKTYLYLGSIYKQAGDHEKAQRQFEMALQCNPHCTEALRELRLQEMRQKKESGFFTKLFKR